MCPGNVLPHAVGMFKTSMNPKCKSDRQRRSGAPLDRGRKDCRLTRYVHGLGTVALQCHPLRRQPPCPVGSAPDDGRGSHSSARTPAYFWHGRTVSGGRSRARDCLRTAVRKARKGPDLTGVQQMRCRRPAAPQPFVGPVGHLPRGMDEYACARVDGHIVTWGIHCRMVRMKNWRRPRPLDSSLGSLWDNDPSEENAVHPCRADHSHAAFT